jgi:glycosyltransferase involved in cell wall biosynthesis
MTDGLGSGGTERQVIQLVRLLQTSGRYQIYLACHQKRGELLDDAKRLGLGEIIEYPLNNFYDRNFLVQLRRCVRFLKENKIDVVHTHDFYTNIFGMIAAWLAGVPARIASKRETEGFRNSLQKRAERYAFALAHSVITNANAVKNQLTNEGVREGKLLTFYNGLDISRVVPQSDLHRDAMLAMLKLPQQPPERRFVTIVANVQHVVKDHPTFLRAAARVRRAIPQASFVLAGQGALTNDLQELARHLGIERDTFFLGHCERIAELLAVSEVCVLSSKAEGFSNSILEYMAASRPVVVTDVGGAREAVIDGETGFIVPAGDEETMAARIVTLLNEPERARAMGEQGRLIVEEKFSCEAQLERTSALYDWLLTKPSRTVEPTLKSLHGKRA